METLEKRILLTPGFQQALREVAKIKSVAQ